MMIAKSNSFSICILIIIIIASTHAVTFTIQNNCPITVWAAAVPVGGGRRLGLGESWTIDVPAGRTQGRIWARTGCSFDGAGRGQCRTGDCDGLLQCRSSGVVVGPCTLAEFSLNQSNDTDFFDLSLVDGFNVPIEMRPENSRSCSRVIRCVADINGQCPAVLRASAGGCHNPCTVYRTNQYCCNNNGSDASCGPTDLSRFFKERCPDAYSYPRDDGTSIFTCPGGTNYNVFFCP